MTEEWLKEKGGLYFTNILDGIQAYPSHIVVMDREEAKEQFLLLWEKNGSKDSFLDFHYFQLERDAQERANSHLTQNERMYLKQLKARANDGVIFSMERTLMEIAVKLNEMEVLFSTFYFTGEKSTWWGNYKTQYVVLWEVGKCPIASLTKN